MKIFLVNAMVIAQFAYGATKIEEIKTVDISQEAEILQQDLQIMNEEIIQTILSDENYSDKVKIHTCEKLSKIKFKDKDIQGFVKDRNISQKKKHRILKGLNRLKHSIQDDQKKKSKD